MVNHCSYLILIYSITARNGPVLVESDIAYLTKPSLGV